MKLKKITNYLEEIAPLEYQESYDNSGLLLGDYNIDIKGVLITLDITEEVVEEAILNGFNMIVSHHPILFNGIKSITGRNYIERIILKAIQHNIALYSIHTNLDNIINGVNGAIAKKLKLKKCRVIQPKSDILRKLVVYCPKKNTNQLRDALFVAGAGSLGKYDKCSFMSIGEGTFRAGIDANPYLGNIGDFHIEKEDKLEVIYPRNKELHLLSAMKDNHPYEEIAYQIYAICNLDNLVGNGIIGELNKPIKTIDFLTSLKATMNTEVIRHTAIVKDYINKVAVCGGSGSFLLKKAINQGADIFISSDFKYHQFFDSEDNIIIADIGHYESEQYTKELIYDLLTKKFIKFAVQLSQVNTNPVNYL